jgi:hypothetical protein
MPFPTWLTWSNVWPVLSTLSGWIALGLNLWKQRREKTILEFTISATYAEADHDEIPNTSFEGTPYVHALSVSITNTGQRPITILKTKCKWLRTDKNGKENERTSEAWVNKKLGQADHCVSYPHHGSRPASIISAWAIDSTSKEWYVPAMLIDTLNAKGPKQWN